MVFYFDFISPFGYFAALRIEAIAARHGRPLRWHSMLLGVSVLKVMGLKPLLETPLKGDYIRREFARYVALHGLQLKRQPDDPVMDPRPCGRAFHWVAAHQPHLAAPLALCLLHRYWRDGQDLGSAQAIVGGELPEGLDAQALQAAIDSEEARTLLRNGVQAALDAGVFGSPTVAVEGELFWGVESLATMEAWLGRGAVGANTGL